MPDTAERERVAGAEDISGPDDIAAAPSGGGRRHMATPKLEDRFVRGFVGTTVHVRRYLPFYLGLLGWLMVMALVAPRGGESLDEFEQAAAQFRNESGTSEVDEARSEAPSGRAEEAGSFAFAPEPPGGAAGGSDSQFSGFSEEPGGDDFSSGSSYEKPTFSDDDSFSDTPEPLLITAHGYEHRAAGTPLDRTPEEALPVIYTGSDTARSFLKLEGDETVLRLTYAEDGGQEFASNTAVQMCPITDAGWKPERAQSFGSGPAFDCAKAVVGERTEDVFAFDLSSFGDPVSLPGFALVPVPGSSAFEAYFSSVPAAR